MTEYDFSFKEIVEASNDIIVVTKAEPINYPGPEIVYVNRAFTQLTGYSAAEAIGQSPRMLQTSGTDEKTRHLIHKALENKTPVRATVRNRAKDGQCYWLDLSIMPLKNNSGEVTHFFAIERDITVQKERELLLDRLSQHDPLTGLYNRRAFDAHLEAAFNNFKRDSRKFSVIMIDLDHFKKINDTYGHHAGDAVLRKISTILKDTFRSNDTVARVGGEEFCILLPSSPYHASHDIAETLRKSISQMEFCHLDTSFCLSVSMGISEPCHSDKSADMAVQRADEALYEAKRTGRNRVCHRSAPSLRFVSNTSSG